MTPGGEGGLRANAAAVAVFLDARFVHAEGARALGLRRSGVELDPRALKRVLDSQVLARWGAPMLRVYWYDAAFDPRDPRYTEQRRHLEAVESVPGIRLCLGHLQEVTPGWQRALQGALDRCGVDQAEFRKHFTPRREIQQKEVDTLLALDMARLAQRGVYDVAILLAGDLDLAEPVRLAQDEGCRIELLVPVRAGVATELRHLADDVLTIGPGDLDTIFRRRKATTAAPSRAAFLRKWLE